LPPANPAFNGEQVIVLSTSSTTNPPIMTSAPPSPIRTATLPSEVRSPRPRLSEATDIVVPATSTSPRGPVVIDNAPPTISQPVQRSVPTRVEGNELGAQRVTAPLQRQIVASTRVFLDYRIEALGASGVGKIEVWHTRDMGQSWQKLCEDAHRQSPVEVNLPGEGLHGVTLVVSNGRGFGGTPPNPGDSPDYWIEVDTTRPMAELVYVRPGTGEDSTALHIAWTARDKNLVADATELQFAVRRDGPWQTIARNLKNEGIYRWVPPMDIGPHAYLRISVRDQAGNVATAETVQPVALDDYSRPRGRVVGVTTTPPSRGSIQQVGHQVNQQLVQP
ncbi:MAG: hypothetical protein NZO58_12690, partial [Gemmataceae bacterium]|nr:hypothetical protein [Gemmataceae bacterium]